MERTYLFYDERSPECREIAGHLDSIGVPYTKVKCSGGPLRLKMLVGERKFLEVDEIKDYIENMFGRA